MSISRSERIWSESWKPRDHPPLCFAKVQPARHSLISRMTIAIVNERKHTIAKKTITEMPLRFSMSCSPPQKVLSR